MKAAIKSCIFSICFLFLVSISFAQKSSSIFDQNYFRNPLDIPIQLVSNFGELRPDHFHMGLDIRTQGRENLPVHAAADGYVSRIKIEKYGYGNAVYINHPNGYTTLYAHLNTYYPALNEYIKKKQYQEQSWQQDFELPAGFFPVSKGQVIAYSGNTGGSAGPHLHFEIRNTQTENNINPMLFGFNIPDNQPPVISGLYLYDRRFSTYEVPAKNIALSKKNGNYTSTEKIIKINSPLVSFGISTEDISSSSPFHWGIYSAKLLMDDSLIESFKFDSFSYSDTRYLNASIDYSKYMQNKKWVQYLARLPGNNLNIFYSSGTNGVVMLADTLVHNMQIIVEDIKGNSVALNYAVQLDNITTNYTYLKNVHPLIPGQEAEVDGNNVKIWFSKNAFYDAVPFVFIETNKSNASAASASVQLDIYTVPVHDFYTLQLRTTIPATNPLRNRVVMQLISGTHKQTVKGEWKNDWMQAQFNRLGIAALIIDTVPPSVTTTGWKNGGNFSASSSLTIRCKDDVDDINTFRVELDGQWLLCTNNNNKDDFIYYFDEHCSRGKHTLKIVVSDIAGNITSKQYTFTR